MKLVDFFKKFNAKIKQNNIVLLVLLVYNVVWAICKILFGAITASYFFCVSGVSTLLIGLTKQIYLKNYRADNVEQKRKKAISISVLLIASSLFFVFYMSKYFFLDETKNYGTILSIAIATFSFVELGISIYNFVKAKKSNDILLQSLKGCSLASSCFAIALTQVALLSATNTNANLFNGIIGVVMGVFSALIGIYLLVVCAKQKI